MNTTISRQGFEDLEGVLRLAVEQIVAAPEPAGLAAKLIERAAKWETPTVRAPLNQMSWLYVAAAGGVVALVLLTTWVASGLFRRLPEEKPIVGPRIPSETAPQENRPVQVPSLPKPTELATSDGAAPAGVSQPGTPPRAFGGTPAPGGAQGGAGRFAGANPSRSMSVAAEATVFVSTGGKDPIKLGAKQTFTNEAILHVWDWSESDESRPLAASCSKAFAVSPDGKWIVTADGQRIEIATSIGGRLTNFEGDVRKILFSRDGRRLALLVDAGNNTTTVRVVEFAGGKKLCEIPNIWPAMLPAAFLPDGSETFLMGSDNFVRRYDAATGKELQKYEPAHQNSVRTMIVSPSGKLLASSGSRGDIYLWEVATGKLLHKLTALPEVDASIDVYSLAFSPGEAHLAGGEAWNLLLWSVDTGKVSKQFPSGSGGAEQIRFTADGKTIRAVQGFYGTRGPAGEDLLVFPTIKEWEVARGVE